MKSIILLIALLTAAVYSQTPNWTNVKETNITVGKYDGVDIFTNQEGNHIIVQNSSSLKYYKMNINGQAGSPITLESTSVVTPSISGDESRLYVVYKRTSDNNIIRTKYSTDGGASWSFTSNLSTPTGNASSMESVFSNNKLHVTFEISNIIYYSWYKEGQGWTSPVQVSTSGQNGNTPRIAAWHTSSQDRVLFLYRKNDTESRWREWNAATNNWVNNPQTAFTVSANQSSMPKGFAVDANYIYSYYEYTDYYPYYAIYSQNQQRLRSNNTLVYTSIAQKESFVPKVFSTTTANNISHIAFYFNGLLESGYDIGIIRNKHTGSGITFDQAYQYNYYGQNEPTLINISSASNDVYLIWKDGLSNYLKFIYDDQAPLAPSDYSVSIHQSGSNYYPKLTWQLNNEPDVRLKTLNAYKIERRTRPLNGSWSAWSTIANLSGTTSSYIDYTIGNAGGGDREAEYRLTAIDIGNNSSPSQSVIIDYGFNRAEKTAVTGIVRDYSLEQNYPNPFNPNTNISYSIKEEGLVTLKVYDVLGKEIAVLVNENKPAGVYEVSFNASNLPSGMYIYKLQSGSFTDVKKMLLTK